MDLRADRFSDPVALHGQDTFGPPRKLIDPLQKLFGIVRNLEKPLLQLLLRHTRVIGMASPAFSVAQHLLIRQNGLTDLAPVDRDRFL